MWNGNDENPDNTRAEDDTVHLLRIFSEEVWLLMLDSVEEPEVLENIYNSSLFFHRLLYKRRIEFLLPRIWNPFVFSLRPNKVDFRDSIFPKEILQLRLVSQGWKNVIDNFIQCQAMQQQLIGVTPDPGKLMNISPVEENFLCDIAHSSSQAPRFLTHFEPTHGASHPTKNPFIANKILFEIPFRRAYPLNGFRDKFLTDMTTLLEKYGHFLHICHFRIYDFQQRSESYNEVRNLLLLMPNLKCLYIEFVDIAPDSREASAMKKNVRMDPVSKLDHLEHLITQNVTPDFFNMIVSLHNTVTSLQIQTGADRREYNLHTPSFFNLKQFSISYEDPQQMIDKLRTVNISRGVKILRLRVAARTASLIEIFQELALRFGGTLTHFKLTVILPHNLVGYKSDKDKTKWNQVMADECVVLKNSYLPDTTKFHLDFEEKPSSWFKFECGSDFFKKF